MWNDLYINEVVNKKAMRLFGIEAATYFAELSLVIKRVIEKGTAVDGYFPLDRKYIERELGLNLEQQYNCDSILVRNGILRNRPDNRDWISINNDRWTALIATEDTKILAEVLKQSNLPKSVIEADARNARAIIKAEEKKKRDAQLELERIQKEEKKKEAALTRTIKNDYIKINMKGIARSQAIASNEEVALALENWVDSIYDSKNFLTKAAIEVFCNRIAEFSPNSKVQKELVDMATARSYKDISFVFDLYNRTHGGTATNATKVSQPQKISSAETIDTGISF